MYIIYNTKYINISPHTQHDRNLVTLLTEKWMDRENCNGVKVAEKQMDKCFVGKRERAWQGRDKGAWHGAFCCVLVKFRGDESAKRRKSVVKSCKNVQVACFFTTVVF